LQLYSVRAECKRDLPGTIAAVGKMGYRAVEFAGYYDRSAEELRKMLDDNGLLCCGTHTGLDTLLGDNLAKTIEFNKTLGNKYLVVPGLPGKYRSSRQAWLDTAKLFNELAEKVKPHGMLVGYHNHGVEFQAMDGELPWETFFGNTHKDVIMQLDVGNAIHGGVDPLPYLYRYPGRAVTVHVKEYSKTDENAFVGEGDVNWKAFVALCKAVGNTEWYIVEYERPGTPPLEAVKRCLQNLRKMRLAF
jgi:sugar phosphate isomerase/epimerase